MWEEFVQILPVIIAIIPGIVASVALIFNKKSHDKEIKNLNYLIIEKLDEEFREIEKISGELYLQKIIYNMVEKEYQAKHVVYEWDMIRFHEKIAYLSNKNLIPKHVAEFYKPTFAKALGYVEKYLKMEKDLGNDDGENYSYLLDYCKENNIKSKTHKDIKK